MTVDIDQALLSADPANQVDLPGSDSIVGRRVWARLQFEVRSQHEMTEPRVRRRPRLLAAAICVAAVIAATVVSYEVIPIGGGSPSAQAALLRISQAAADHPTDLTLNPGQWLTSSYDTTANVTVNSEDPGHTFSASIFGTIATWTNSNGVVCVIDSYSTPTFSSATDRQNWVTEGLKTSASSDDQTCSTGAASGAVDVSELSTDPQVLATQLVSGTTGISALDSGSLMGFSNTTTGFQRALELLVGPTIGDTGRFYSTLLAAIAYMPGIADLGSQPTPQGISGEAFSATAPNGRVSRSSLLRRDSCSRSRIRFLPLSRWCRISSALSAFHRMWGQGSHSRL